MTVSIIIAVKTWQKNLEECVSKCRALNSSDFEILILPDEPINRGYSQFLSSAAKGMGAIPVKIIPTGNVNPAKKRDLASKYAAGEIIAFIDDDAYPEKNWLKNALENFKDLNVAAVGGPAVTPFEDTLEQKISGAVYASALVTPSNISFRYIQNPLRRKKEVDDIPSCNFLVRKSIMDELGGFNTDFWPGEDTKLCRDIIKLGKKIIYDPAVLVYHHRRKIFPDHFKQIANYALHRGYFVKRYPENSLRLPYFVPSIFLVFILGGAVLALLNSALRALYFSVLALYLLLVFISCIFNRLNITSGMNLCRKGLLISSVFIGIILTHLCYGFYFVKGLFANKLKEEK